MNTETLAQVLTLVDNPNRPVEVTEAIDRIVAGTAGPEDHGILVEYWTLAGDIVAAQDELGETDA